MENKIYKKNNSLEHLKKIFYLILKLPFLGFLKFFSQKYLKINKNFNNLSFFINNGLTFIKLKFLLFFSGFALGQFILTKKHNKHLSFKKLKKKKR